MPERRIQLGVIGRAHGVRGLVKITSHTADPADLTAYGPLSDAEGQVYALRWKADGVAEVSRIVDGAAVKVTDRAQAEKLTNTRLFVDRSALPPADGVTLDPGTSFGLVQRISRMSSLMPHIVTKLTIKLVTIVNAGTQMAPANNNADEKKPR